MTIRDTATSPFSPPVNAASAQGQVPAIPMEEDTAGTDASGRTVLSLPASSSRAKRKRDEDAQGEADTAAVPASNVKERKAVGRPSPSTGGTPSLRRQIDDALAGVDITDASQLEAALSHLEASFEDGDGQWLVLFGQSLVERTPGAVASGAARDALFASVLTVASAREFDEHAHPPRAGLVRGALLGCMPDVRSQAYLRLAASCVEVIFAQFDNVEAALCALQTLLAAIGPEMDRNLFCAVLDASLRFAEQLTHDDLRSKRFDLDDWRSAAQYLAHAVPAGSRETLRLWVQEAAARMDPEDFGIVAWPLLGVTRESPGSVLRLRGLDSLQAMTAIIFACDSYDLAEQFALSHLGNSIPAIGELTGAIEQGTCGPYGARLANLLLGLEARQVLDESVRPELEEALPRAVAAAARHARAHELLEMGQRYAGGKRLGLPFDDLLGQIYPAWDPLASATESKTTSMDTQQERAEVRRWLRAGMALTELDAETVAGIEGLSDDESLALFTHGDWSHAGSRSELATRIDAIVVARECGAALKARMVAVLAENSARHLDEHLLRAARTAVAAQILSVSGGDWLAQVETKAGPSKQEAESAQEQQAVARSADDFERKPLITQALMPIYDAYAWATRTASIADRHPCVLFNDNEADRVDAYCTAMAGELHTLESHAELSRLTRAECEQLKERIAMLRRARDEALLAATSGHEAGAGGALSSSSSSSSSSTTTDG